MTTTELLAVFANPETMKALSISDKLSAGLVTTVLGMGITFAALIILMVIISWMNKLLGKSMAVSAKKVAPAPVEAVVPVAAQTRENDNELVAAITTALAVSLQTSTSNIVIRNIEKVEHGTPRWNRAGIIEQMNSRL
ncbi:OadG family protein [Desulforhopalus sp. IMCC35007]|uniref:OadG family protein n=1 Tax=Desulforhopalus sp. IMCC35007 TaxID=2569543 RepID=UPI0010ADD61A|nr:OadG family protein [Desulforhopalus sp. IMCC35007]TKB09112.1 sodium pump decarboxylase subunit gamma [Desulforhopalus sp. IMCC35007]